jgi:hypothetical protein
MEKQQYLTPEMEVIKIALQKQILEGSDSSIEANREDYGDPIYTEW